MIYLAGVFAALLIALVSLRIEVPGRRRNLRIAASVVVLAMLWYLAPRAAVNPATADSTAPTATPDSIQWSQRIVVGDPVEVRGRVDSTQTIGVRLIGPDGRVDSTVARGAFAVRSRAVAVGHWTWKLIVANDTLNLGVDVRPLPSLRILLLEGRPSFETTALAKRLVGQGASVTSVTRLTSNDVQVVQGGPRPPSKSITRESLASLDALILAPASGALLSSADRTLVLDEVSRGLGLLHLVDTLYAGSALFPFGTSTVGIAAVKVHPVLSGAPVATPLSIAPISLSGGKALLDGAAREAIARVAEQGVGKIGAVRMPALTGWTLAGEDSLAGAFWSELLTPLLRPARAEWRLNNATHARVDERLIVERIGDTSSTAQLSEGGSPGRSVNLVSTPGDSLRRRGALWPNTPGWLSLSTDGDTVWLLVEPPRRLTAEGPEPGDGFPALRWLAWAVLLTGIATLWRRR